jgi:hypothetical protein
MFDQEIWQSAYQEAIRAGESTRTAREYADEYERDNRADPNEWAYVEPAVFDAVGRL